jgi:carboxyl-terminal processing protease
MDQTNQTFIPFNEPPIPQSPEIKKEKKPVKWIAVLLFAIIVSYAAGYKTGIKGFIYSPKEFKVINKQDQPQGVDYDLLWNAIDIVKEKYIEKAPTDLDFLYGAVKGAVESTGDPYTTFFPPQELQDFKTQLQGSFDGIGAEIGEKNGNIVIVAPLPDSPAKKAGILPGDIIAKVNNESTQGWSSEEAVSKIRGKKGTEVTLTIVREGKTQAFDVKIIRDKIVIKSVRWEYKEIEKDGQKKNIAVITVSQFGDDTKGLFDSAVNDILTHSVSGIVLDLRSNPGGYLQTAVDLASNWVNKGDVVVTEARANSAQPYNAEGNNRLKGIKTVVLINGGSASASEILSGALHDHNLAELVGEKSFGKGSVQELIDLKDGAAVKVTIAKWITPGGKNLNKNGLDPDVETKLTDQDIKDGKDRQMEKALEEVVK